MAVRAQIAGSSPDLVVAGVTVPGPLVDAIEDGSLVVFAGAGISQGPPACWYGFERLAEKMAAGSYIEREGADLDVWLGRVEKSERVVERRVRRYFLSKDPETNPPHKAIVRLWPRGAIPRIVTTNYDALFEKADGSLRTWGAPALPRGDDFVGVVHLHGDAHDPSSSLVVTDRDFGRAYLSEGWARDFLLSLYRTATVLFVGYRHDDTITSYLARGLGTGGPPKYVLWPRGEGQGVHTWEALGVASVEFPVTFGDFSALTDVLEGLGAYVRKTEAERHGHIRTVVEAGPDSISDEDASVLRRTLAHDGRVRYFTETARGLGWLRWLRDQGFLDRLVGRGAPVTSSDLEVGQWLAGLAATDDGQAVRAILTEMGGQMEPKVVAMIAHKVWFAEGDSLERLQNWGAALLRPPVLTESLEVLLAEAPKHGAWALALAAVDEALRPEIALREDFFSAVFAEESGEVDRREENDQVEVRTRPLGGMRRVVEVCHELLAVGDTAIVSRLLRLATEHLARGHDLYRAAGEDWPDGDDPWSYAVKEIGPLAEGYEHPDDGKHTLVRLAVSAHDVLTAPSPDAAARVRAGWAGSGYSLLRRLALRCTPADRDDEVLGVVASHPILFRQGRSAEEAFSAVVRSYPRGSDESKRAIEEVLQREGTRYTFAAWAARELDIPLPRGDARETLRATSGATRLIDPIPALLNADPCISIQALEDALWGEAGNVPQVGPGRQVGDAASNEVWARTMIECLGSSERWGSPIWRPLLWGLRNAWSGGEWQRGVLREIAGWPIVAAADERAGFVESVVRESGIDTDTLMSAESMLSRAIEDGAVGQNAVAAAVAIVRKRRGYEPLGGGDLLDLVAQAFREHPEARAAAGALVGELWTADEGWTREHVVPLFEAEEEGVALGNHAWRGLLEGDVSPEFLPRSLVPELAVFLPDHVASIEGAVRDRPELHLGPPSASECERAEQALAVPAERAVSLLVRAALLSGDDPYDVWLGQFIHSASPSVRSLWATRMGIELRSPSTAQNVWLRWGESYLARRVDGIPQELHPCEARTLFSWVAALSEGAFTEGVRLLLKAPLPARAQMDFVRTLNDAGAASHSPEAVTDLLALALKSGALSRIWSDDLREVVRDVAAAAPGGWQDLEDRLLLTASMTASELQAIRPPSDSAESLTPDE